MAARRERGQDAAAGVILAGGRARRMGGGDKALLQVGGRPILDRVLAVLRPHLECIVISANGRPGRFAAFGCPVLPDPPGLQDAGPLAGLAAAAAALPGRVLLTVPGDTPFLPADLVPRLLQAAGSGGAFARSGGRPHPIVAAYPPAVLAGLPDWLAQGGRAVTDFLAQAGAVAVDWPDTGGDPFLNLNRPEDLETARRRG